MTELEVQGQEIDPEEYFYEGFATGQETAASDLREQIADKLDDAGFDSDEIEEALFSGDTDVYAPRRRKHKRHAKRHAKRYDPAPRRGRGRGRGRKTSRKYDPVPKRKIGTKVKGMLGRLKGLAFPVAAGGSFIMQYAARADTLKAAGSITTGGYPGILKAIQWDISHFNASDAMTRISGNLSTIGVPLIGGYLVKNIGGGLVKSGVERDVIEIAGDLLMGYGAALGTKKVLDPPVEIVQQPRQIMRHVQQPQIQMQMQQPQMQVQQLMQMQQQETYIPWGY